MGLLKKERFLKNCLCAALLCTALFPLGLGSSVSSARAQDALPAGQAMPAPGGTGGLPAAPEDVYELVLQVKRDQEILTNSFLAFQRGFDGYYLPVKGLADLLGLYIEMDLAAGKASGWYLAPGADYAIDAAAGAYTLRGELVDFAPGDIFVKDFGSGFGDIYVRFETLAQIWPLAMTLDFSTLRLDIGTEDKLPYEKKRDRLARREYLLAQQAKEGAGEGGFTDVDNSYRLFSPPVADISTATRWDSSEKTWDNRTNLSGKNDLLGFSADYNLNAQYTDGHFISPEDLRLTMARHAFGPEPMPLGLREVRLGDIGLRTPDLTVNTSAGRGAYVSSRPVKRAGTFDEITVEGASTPGWEVELYRNSELLDFGTVPENGYYRFENVALLTGSNRISVMLYGPQGQTEERTEIHQLGGGLLPPGEIEYEAGVVDVSDNLISLKKDDEDTAGAEGEDGISYSGGARVGVSRWMSVFATGTKAVTVEGDQKYGTLGTDISLGQAHANIEAYKQVGGGTALDARLATSLMGWRVNLRNQLLNDFESEKVGFDDNARVRETRASVSNRFATGIGQAGITMSADYEKTKDERTNSRYQLNTTLAQHRHTLGNRLSAYYNDGELSRADGFANAAFRLGRKTNVRGKLDYDIKPHFAFDAVSADIDHRYSDKLSGGLDVGHNLQSKQSTVGANVNYDFDKFLGSLSSSWREGNGVNITLRASTSLAPFGKNGSYVAKSRNMTGQNAVNTTAYLDRNLNDLYDEGDEAVPGAVMMLDARAFEEPADEEGFAGNIGSGFGDYGLLRFKENSTDNPFHAASNEGYRLLLRPGIAQHIDFALVETGIVDGTAAFDDGKPVPGLKLQLLDRKGRVVKEAMTSFDGFYTFEFVKPGQYAIRPDPLLDVTVPTRLVSVSQDAPFAYGLDMKLLNNAGLPPSPVQVDAQLAQQNIAPVIDVLGRLQQTLSKAAAVE